MFTSLSVPVMTRLRMNERLVLDTLVGAGVARSRSEALAWCVRLVGDHQGDWIQQLRDALVAVEAADPRAPLHPNSSVRSDPAPQLIEFGDALPSPNSISCAKRAGLGRRREFVGESCVC